MNIDHLAFIYDYALTIEGLIILIILITIGGVTIDDWMTRYSRKHMKRMADEHASNPGAESYRGER